MQTRTHQAIFFIRFCQCCHVRETITQGGPTLSKHPHPTPTVCSDLHDNVRIGVGFAHRNVEHHTAQCCVVKIAAGAQREKLRSEIGRAERAQTLYLACYRSGLRAFGCEERGSEGGTC